MSVHAPRRKAVFRLTALYAKATLFVFKETSAVLQHLQHKGLLQKNVWLSARNCLNRELQLSSQITENSLLKYVKVWYIT